MTTVGPVARSDVVTTAAGGSTTSVPEMLTAELAHRLVANGYVAALHAGVPAEDIRLALTDELLKICHSHNLDLRRLGPRALASIIASAYRRAYK
jgi:hypothetical protein